MAVTITAALQSANKHSLVYKLTASGAGTGTLVAAGAVTPDLDTDSVNGPLRDILTPAYASQAAARAKLSDGSLRITFLNRTAAQDYLCDANVSGTDFELDLTTGAADALGTFMLIEARHSIEL